MPRCIPRCAFLFVGQGQGSAHQETVCRARAECLSLFRAFFSCPLKKSALFLLHAEKVQLMLKTLLFSCHAIHLASHIISRENPDCHMQLGLRQVQSPEIQCLSM